MASEDTIHWPSILDAWKALGYCDPHDCVSAAILSTWKGGTRDAYASHLRRLAQIGGRTAWNDAQRVVELALFQMFKMGFRKATLRGCVSAVKACVVLGWLPELNWTRLWRITKAPVDSEVHRPYGGPDVLQIIAEACTSVEDWITYAGCVLSFSSLSRVGEVSSARRNGVGKSYFSFWGLKRGERWVTRQLGPYAAVWARWLRRIRPGCGILLFSAAQLEENMEKLLKGSIRAEARWHAWRRAGATYLRAFGLPWRFLCWWGRWASVKMAHYYATPPDEFDMVDEARLPWPTDTGFTWKGTHLALLWPKSLRDLFDEKPTIKKPSSESRKNARDSSKQVVDSDSEGDAACPPQQGRSRCEPIIVGEAPPATAKRRKAQGSSSNGRSSENREQPRPSSVSTAGTTTSAKASVTTPPGPPSTATSSGGDGVQACAPTTDRDKSTDSGQAASKFAGRVRSSVTGARRSVQPVRLNPKEMALKVRRAAGGTAGLLLPSVAGGGAVARLSKGSGLGK